MKKQHKKDQGIILIPPQYIKLQGPMIFLAGPIQGARDWQTKAIKYIRSLNSKVHILSPRRTIKFKGQFSETMYNEQVDWERFYLKRAGKNGVIMFWLAKEAKHISRRAYAQTTRFELGETVARHHFLKVKVVVGIEEGFSNARYIRRALMKTYPKIPICNTLEKTCQMAIKKAAQ